MFKSLTGILTAQTRGMYTILFLKVLKTKDYVRNNVRKWPNLCSIRSERSVWG